MVYGSDNVKFTRLILPEDDADASKHVAMLTIYKILIIYVCCALVGVDNKLYKMDGTYIKIGLPYSEKMSDMFSSA
jgi:3-hydroxymyristoyl/3-hydroxydecanoyl-(acyl carrier protein) dehydratase